ncbi:hypothetical protein LOAG_17104 [Loa loa]|uniref:ACB domain-containing protein n=1 Tax=Loa loa TaxID=7209 RepID=A0A1S0UJQ6_LOALO|nr:hypothetical protein LOAG_17104 [Loa loa]EJD75819.1 hypothetical protein LOAG_17104 [Loa loa]
MEIQASERDDDTAIAEIDLIMNKFGAPLEDVYKLAVSFYRERKQSCELMVPYEKRLLFMAYSKQVRHGPYDAAADDSGWFDLIGNDRMKAWKDLGNLSASDAMSAFITLLDVVCPPFRDFVSEHLQSQTNLRSEHQQNNVQSDASQAMNDMEKFEAQRQQIQEALNRQTYHQFRAYAQQQFVGDLIQQEALIKQLQEQHYQQYMAQIYAQQAKVVGASPESGLTSAKNLDGEDSAQNKADSEGKRNPNQNSDVSDEEAGEDLPSNPVIAPASMWNRQDIVEFKTAIRKEGSESIIKVGHGETVTVRVPTHEEGSCLFWEFATDHYDIGFGVFFEWTISQTNHVSVHVSESSDEEADEDFLQVELRTSDVESGSSVREKQMGQSKPHVDEIVPIYRRDCHEEVYAGSHVYPGQGVYLLKFDNSYSLWRSKTLYYRVYYSN